MQVHVAEIEREDIGSFPYVRMSYHELEAGQPLVVGYIKMGRGAGLMGME